MVQLHADHRPARHPGIHPRSASGQSRGYGSNPFIDIGAYQYVNLHPPEVTDVREVPPPGRRRSEFYTVGGISGANTTPWQINIYFNGPLDPNTVNASTVQLVNLGSNPSQPLDQDINLAGKLTYHTSAPPEQPNTSDDQPGRQRVDAQDRRLSDHPVRQRIAGARQPPGHRTRRREHGRRRPDRCSNWPSPPATGIPAAISTTPSSSTPRRRRSAGHVHVDPASDTNIVGDNITSDASPTFDGTISEPNPQLVPLAGQTAILDIGIALLNTAS